MCVFIRTGLKTIWNTSNLLEEPLVRETFLVAISVRSVWVLLLMWDCVAIPTAKRIADPITPLLYPQTSYIYALTLSVRRKESKLSIMIKKPRPLDIYHRKSLWEHFKWIIKAELLISLSQNYFDSEIEKVD